MNRFRRLRELRSRSPPTVVDMPTLALQYDVQPSISVAHPRCSQILQAYTELYLRTASRLVGVGASVKPGGPASPPLADLVGTLQVLHDVSSPGRLFAGN